jgi:glycosyltransferase involved in cell wall biosynthesis
VSSPAAVAVVPAHDEADVVALTVEGLRSLPEICDVIVADDGSRDGTSRAALAAGATVLRSSRRAGKGAALARALARPTPADAWLLADADLGATVIGLRPVVAEVLAGRADIAVALPPPQAGGGFGLVRRFATWGIARECGFLARAPLSGQRALTPRALQACSPLAAGFGVEVGMTVDAIRAGLRVVEIPADVAHRPTGRGPRGFAHRGRQAVDIAVALARRLR